MKCPANAKNNNQHDKLETANKMVLKKVKQSKEKNKTEKYYLYLYVQ